MEKCLTEQQQVRSLLIERASRRAGVQSPSPSVLATIPLLLDRGRWRRLMAAFRFSSEKWLDTPKSVTFAYKLTSYKKTLNKL
jgi:hypothetical protein